MRTKELLHHGGVISKDHQNLKIVLSDAVFEKFWRTKGMHPLLRRILHLPMMNEDKFRFMLVYVIN